MAFSTTIHLYLPFATAAALNPATIVREFKQRWETKIISGEAEQLVSLEEDDGTYLLGNGTHNIRLKVSDRPLSGELVDALLMAVPGLEDSHKNALQNHKGYVSVDYLFGPNTPVERVRFAAQVLLVLVQQEGALGYANISAMLYRPRDHVQSLFEQAELPSFDLYMLFVHTHWIEEGEGNWIHTHGMEQFDAPDLQVRFAEKTQHQYYSELLSNTSIYMIEPGPVLNPGHTMELKGDGVIYEIKSPTPVPGHPFGSFGSLEILRK